MNQATLSLLTAVRQCSAVLANQYINNSTLQAIPSIQAAYITFTAGQDVEAAQLIDLQTSDEIYLQEFRKHMAWIQSIAGANRNNCPDLVHNAKAPFIDLFKALRNYATSQIREPDPLTLQIIHEIGIAGQNLATIRNNLGITLADLAPPGAREDRAIIESMLAQEGDRDDRDNGCDSVCYGENEARNGCVGNHPMKTVASFLGGLVFGGFSVAFTSKYSESHDPEDKGVAISQGVIALICFAFAFRLPIKNAVGRLCGFGGYQAVGTQADTETTALINNDHGHINTLVQPGHIPYVSTQQQLSQ